MWTVSNPQLPRAQNESELAHYGVKGMKWGVRKEYKKNPRRKGTPELNRELMDVSKKTSEFYRKVTDSNDNPRFKKRYGYFRHIETNKGTTILGFDGSLQREAMRKLAKEEFGSTYLPESEAVKRFESLPKLDKETTRPFRQFAVNKNGPSYERLHNCFECTLAYEMRYRGYDVQANEKHGGYTLEYHHAFDIKDSFDITSYSGEEAYKCLREQCLSYGEGARGAIGVQWISGGGHGFSWEVKNGEFRLIDTQQAGRDKLSYFDGCDPTNISVFRLDNAEPLPGVVDFVEPFEEIEGEEDEAAKEFAKQKRAEVKVAAKKALLAIEDESLQRRSELKDVGRKIADEFAKQANRIASDIERNKKEVDKKISNIKNDGRKFMNDVLSKVKIPSKTKKSTTKKKQQKNVSGNQAKTLDINDLLKSRRRG